MLAYLFPSTSANREVHFNPDTELVKHWVKKRSKNVQKHGHLYTHQMKASTSNKTYCITNAFFAANNTSPQNKLFLTWYTSSSLPSHLSKTCFSQYLIIYSTLSKPVFPTLKGPKYVDLTGYLFRWSNFLQSLGKYTCTIKTTRGCQ